jgi:hypothetical protein
MRRKTGLPRLSKQPALLSLRIDELEALVLIGLRGAGAPTRSPSRAYKKAFFWRFLAKQVLWYG